MTTVFASFPGTPDSVAAVRRFVVGAIRACPQVGASRDAVERVELIVSELATNAIRHTHSGDPGKSFTVRMNVNERGVWTEVHTLAPRRWNSVPRVVEPDDPPREHGRGLFLVDLLASRWGRLAPGQEGVYSVLYWDDCPRTWGDRAVGR